MKSRHIKIETEDEKESSTNSDKILNDLLNFELLTSIFTNKTTDQKSLRNQHKLTSF